MDQRALLLLQIHSLSSTIIMRSTDHEMRKRDLLSFLDGRDLEDIGIRLVFRVIHMLVGKVFSFNPIILPQVRMWRLDGGLMISVALWMERKIQSFIHDGFNLVLLVPSLGFIASKPLGLIEGLGCGMI